MISILLCAIQLTGVTGADLRARAFFDANNVKVGDPMVLTIDFIGEADFRNLHPPALAKAVGRQDWKLDDVSAKTDTFRDARRLTYRVRPMREGVLWFPALEFEYEGPNGEKRIVRANDIPVHAKGGAQVVVAEMGEDRNEMPAAPELVRELRAGGQETAVSEDVEFAWQKALTNPTADAFAEFDFPLARMNEATCAIREGNWARAMKIYQRLEWTLGQTPEIEQGIVAALALRHDNPSVELPVWRQVLRPILRFGWKGRIGIVFGGFAALTFLFWFLGRGIRAVACVVLVVGCCTMANAQGVFRQIEEQMERMRQQMEQSMGGFSMHFGEKMQRDTVEITAFVATSKRDLQVGDPFEFVLSIEYPKTASVGQVQIVPSESFGLTFTGQAQNLTDGRSSNTNNVVKRLAVPARYDVPYRGKISFAVTGMVSARQQNHGFSFSYSNSFQVETEPLAICVSPLPTAHQPADYGGIVSEGLRIHEMCDILQMETNDIVTITYKMYPNGYVPADFLPKDVAFEWMRQTDDAGQVREIEYRRYFVADGATATPKLTVSYYDPRTKTYKSVKTGGTPLKYEATGR